jgi:hypothetical protein
MAKVPFTKLKCKINIDEVPVQIGEETIAVKQYLPIQEKLELIGNVVMAAHEQDENYSNPVKANVYRDLEVVFAYTNINFTDKQKEDLPKLYDMLKSSGVLEDIIKAIPVVEYDDICAGVWQSINSIYAYQNSVLGILDTIKTDYNNMKLDIDSLNHAITDPETLEFVKALLTNVN